MNGGAMLEWTTASEENNNYFAVEMSRSAGEFAQLATLTGKGTTESLNTYSYEATNLRAGTYYFRLRQVDFDGQTTFSDVVSVQIGSRSQFNLVNTMAHDVLTIDIDTPRPVRIVNMAGSVLASQTLEIGRNNIDVSNLPAGMYILTDGTQSKRFVK
jgi:hypothetical protein